MMMICNYNTTVIEYGLLFDEQFCMAQFSMNFDLDTEAENSSFGHVEFEPEKCLATMVYYGHPEDLSATIEHYDLNQSDEGRDVLEAFHHYNLRELYYAAQRFTGKVVNDYLAEVERVWQEYLRSTGRA